MSSKVYPVVMNVRKFIGQVALRRPLWDQRDPLYHNRIAIDHMWEEVATMFSLPTDAVKRKWKGLRDTFRKEMKKTQWPDEGKAWTTWPHFKSLMFLKGAMWPGGVPEEEYGAIKEETLSEGEGTVDGEESQSAGWMGDEDLVVPFAPGVVVATDYSAPSPPLALPPPRKRPRYDLQDGEDSRPAADIDDDYHFLMSLLPSFKDLPSQRKMYLRIKYQELLYSEIMDLPESAG